MCSVWVWEQGKERGYGDAGEGPEDGTQRKTRERLGEKEKREREQERVREGEKERRRQKGQKQLKGTKRARETKRLLRAVGKSPQRFLSYCNKCTQYLSLNQF